MILYVDMKQCETSRWYLCYGTAKPEGGWPANDKRPVPGWYVSKHREEAFTFTNKISLNDVNLGEKFLKDWSAGCEVQREGEVIYPEES